MGHQRIFLYACVYNRLLLLLSFSLSIFSIHVHEENIVVIVLSSATLPPYSNPGRNTILYAQSVKLPDNISNLHNVNAEFYLPADY